MQDVEQRLRNDIVSGAFAFGSRLVMEDLASRYGVSHMPIREALRVLHGEGLVVIEHNRGAHVRPMYSGFIEDLFDMRAAVETMLARRAAQRRTADHIKRLREAAAKLEAHVAAGAYESVPIANREFHRVINDAAGHPGALPIVDSHWLLLAALLKRYGYGDDRFARVIEEHQQLAQAIDRGDGYAASVLMGAHIEKAKQNLLERSARETKVPGVTRVFRPSWVVGALSLLAVIGLYWYLATRPGVNPALVPSPPTIMATFGEQLQSGDLWVNTYASLKRVLIGYALGAAAALILGALAGWFRYWGYVLNPIIDALRPIPALAYIPLVIVWIGIGEPSRILIIALAVFKPIVVNARAGMQEVAQIYVDAARTLGASKWRVFRTVALPSAVPYFIAGMRTGVSTGFLALVAAELIAAPSGLGFMIQNAGQYFRTDITIVGIIVIGLLGALLDQIANRAGRALTSWSEVRRDA